MKLGEQAMAGALGLIACAGLMWAGIAFAGYALLTWLSPGLGLAGAAAITAVILLVGPIVAFTFRGRPKPEPEPDLAKGADSVLSAISKVAKERPLVAMIAAVVFGAAEVYLNQRRKKK